MKKSKSIWRKLTKHIVPFGLCMAIVFGMIPLQTVAANKNQKAIDAYKKALASEAIKFDYSYNEYGLYDLNGDGILEVVWVVCVGHVPAR